MHFIFRSMDFQSTLTKIDVPVYLAVAIYLPFIIFAAMGLAEAHSKKTAIPLHRSYTVASILILGGLFAPFIVLFAGGKKPNVPSEAIPLLAVFVLAPPIIAFVVTAFVFKYRQPKHTSNPKRVYSEEVEEIRDWLWYAQPFMDLESLDEEVKRQKAKRLADSPNISDESKDGA